MLLNGAFILSHPLLVTGFFTAAILIKTFLAVAASFALGFPLRTALMVGLSISQIGEFSFILARAGMAGRLLTDGQYQLFLAVTVISMAATPFIVALSPRISESALKLPLLRRLGRGPRDLPEPGHREISDHLIIVGFGINGKNVAGAAKSAGIPYTIIEMNPDTVRRENANGEPIHYGDASQEAILRQARIDTAQVMVVAIADSAATFRITEVARHLSPKLYLIVRTRFIQDMQELYRLGASEVIPEEFETSVEIFVRVLARYLVPRNEIERLVSEVRSDGYEMFRSLTPQASAEGPRIPIPSIDISTIRVPRSCPAEARSIGEIDLRKNYGATVLAIGRGDKTLSNPGRDVKILAGDTIYLLVARPDLPAVEKLFTKC
jgi:CPA2 family monovalent cation:H+ antiporter-2